MLNYQKRSRTSLMGIIKTRGIEVKPSGVRGAKPPDRKRATSPLPIPQALAEETIKRTEKEKAEEKANVKLAKTPDYVLAAWETWHARCRSGEFKPVQTGIALTILIERGDDYLQSEPNVVQYVDLREQTLRDLRFDPAFKAGLRKWLKGCSWEPPIAYGSTSSYGFKTTKKAQSWLSGRASELGLTLYSLGVALLARGLADEDIREDERIALLDIYNSLVTEMGARTRELQNRIDSHLRGEK